MTTTLRYWVRDNDGLTVLSAGYESDHPAGDGWREYTGSVRAHVSEQGLAALRAGRTIAFSARDQSYRELSAPLYAE